MKPSRGFDTGSNPVGSTHLFFPIHQTIVRFQTVLCSLVPITIGRPNPIFWPFRIGTLHSAPESNPIAFTSHPSEIDVRSSGQRLHARISGVGEEGFTGRAPGTRPIPEMSSHSDSVAGAGCLRTLLVTRTTTPKTRMAAAASSKEDVYPRAAIIGPITTAEREVPRFIRQE